MNTTEELCFNLWATLSHQGIIDAIAAKSYTLSGSDEEKSNKLSSLAKEDYKTAKHFRVPDEHSIVLPDGKEHKGFSSIKTFMENPVSLFYMRMRILTEELPTKQEFPEQNSHF